MPATSRSHPITPAKQGTIAARGEKFGSCWNLIPANLGARVSPRGIKNTFIPILNLEGERESCRVLSHQTASST